MSLGMRTYEFQSTGVDNRTVPANVIVIADTAEAAPAMNGFQIFCGKGTVCPGSATMHYNHVDTSHKLNEISLVNNKSGGQ